VQEDVIDGVQTVWRTVFLRDTSDSDERETVGAGDTHDPSEIPSCCRHTDLHSVRFGRVG